MDQTTVMMIVATIIALVLEVFPPVKNWWDSNFSAQWKPLVLLVLFVTIPPALTLAACLGVNLGGGAVCADPSNPQTWVNAVLLGFAAFTANYLAHRVDQMITTLARKEPVTLTPVASLMAETSVVRGAVTPEYPARAIVIDLNGDIGAQIPFTELSPYQIKTLAEAVQNAAQAQYDKLNPPVAKS